MRKILSIFIVSTIALVSFGVLAETIKPKSQSSEIKALGTRYTVYSSILGEDRQILVRLPEGYGDSNKRYPTIYILDGASHFAHASLGADILEEEGRMPHSIIVGIPNASGMRGRDLRDEQENFRRFIDEEVIQFIENRYQTNNLRTLYGHSLAAEFAFGIFADHGNTFDNYIASSAPLRRELVQRFEQLLSSSAQFSHALYFTLGSSAEEGVGRVRAFHEMVDALNTKAPIGLRWKHDRLEGHAHMTTPFLTVYNGLSHVFSDFQEVRFDTVAAYEEAGGMQAVQTFFEARAKKYDMKPEVPPSMFVSLGYLYLGEAKYEKSLAVFKEATEFFPESEQVFSGLGHGYDLAGMPRKSLQAYQVALKIAEKQFSASSVAYYKHRIGEVSAKLSK